MGRDGGRFPRRGPGCLACLGGQWTLWAESYLQKMQSLKRKRGSPESLLRRISAGKTSVWKMHCRKGWTTKAPRAS